MTDKRTDERKAKDEQIAKSALERGSVLKGMPADERQARIARARAQKQRRQLLRQDMGVLRSELADLRKRSGLTQKQIANQLGTGQAAVSRIERGADSGMTLDSLLSYAEAVSGGSSLVALHSPQAVIAIQAHRPDTAIIAEVQLSGARPMDFAAVIDSEAAMTFLPLRVVHAIGAAMNPYWTFPLNGALGPPTHLNPAIVDIGFADLGLRGRFVVGVSDLLSRPIVGMDVLNRLGVRVDTRDQRLSLNESRLDQSKTALTPVDGAFIGAALLNAIFGGKAEK